MRRIVFAAQPFRVGIAVVAFLTPFAYFALFPSVHAQEAQVFPCGPIERAAEMARATGGAPYVTLSGDQFQFVRGLFVMAPDTPSSLPPGDHAALSMRADGSASIVFLDGDAACAPMKLGKEGVDILMQVGRGEFVHSGRGL